MREIIYKSGLTDTAVFRLTPKHSLKGILNNIKENKPAIRDITKLQLENGGAIIIIEYHRRPKELLIFRTKGNASKYYNIIKKQLKGVV